MLAKLLVPHCRSWAQGLVPLSSGLAGRVVQRHAEVKLIQVRRSGDLIPPSQYDIAFPNKLKLGHALKVNWEIIPLFVVTCTSIFILIFSIIWACKNKVDVVFSTHSCNNISRTMNLRKPTVHKIIIINQRYEPWPEMQDVLDKMLVAEHRAHMKATKCSYEQREGHPPEGN